MIVGLDIGTCNIRVVIAQINAENEIEIIGVSKNPSKGLRDGIIVNIEDAKNSIKDAIVEAEIKAGVDEVTGVYVSIGGSQVTSVPVGGMAGTNTKGHVVEITPKDKDNALQSALAVRLPMDEKRLHLIPQEYIVDGVEYPNPIGINGVRLEVKALLVKVSSAAFKNVQDCIMRAGYSLQGMALKTLASAYAVLRKDERDMGSILIDFGGGSTDVLVLNKDAPVFTTSIPYGGNIVTKDIEAVMGVPFNIAEDLKIKYGTCYMNEEEEDEEVIVPSVGGLPPESKTRSFLCEIIRTRMEEILMSARKEVVKKSGQKILNGAIVLTGGGSLMPGIETLTQVVWNTSAVRIGSSADFGGAYDAYRNADFATAVGLVVASNKNDSFSSGAHKKDIKKDDPDAGNSWFKRLLKKIK